MADMTREEIERALKPGGYFWFVEIVDRLHEIAHTVGGMLIENKLLAMDFGLARPDFAALPRPEQLFWMQAARVEVDHRDVEERVLEIIQEFKRDGRASAQEVFRPFPQDILLRKELNNVERKKWTAIGRRAARGGFSENDLYRAQERRISLVCNQPNRPIRGVYFITADRQRVKIGYASDIVARIRTLQIGQPDPLHLMLAIPGGPGDEHALYRRFAMARGSGEWFRLTDELMAFIEAERAKAAK